MPAPGPAIAAAWAAATALSRVELLRALDAHAGNQTRAAEALGLALATLKRRLAAAGLTAEELRQRYPLSARQPPRGKNQKSTRTP